MLQAVRSSEGKMPISVHTHHRFSKRFLLTLASPTLLVALLVIAATWQLESASAASTVLAEAPPGFNAIEFVGRADQNGADFVSYGYLTYVRGLNNSQLYTNPAAPSEATARFTFYTTATLTARAVISTVFALDSAGITTWYYNPTPAASFANPASFANGAAIATGNVRYQDILNVQGPNLGIATGAGEMVQTTAASFQLGGQTYQVGAPGWMLRLATTGEGHRTDPVAPKSFVFLAGNAVVTGQNAYLPAVQRSSP
jgi:hypothetical protein